MDCDREGMVFNDLGPRDNLISADQSRHNLSSASTGLGPIYSTSTAMLQDGKKQTS